MATRATAQPVALRADVAGAFQGGRFQSLLSSLPR